MEKFDEADFDGCGSSDGYGRDAGTGCGKASAAEREVSDCKWGLGWRHAVFERTARRPGDAGGRGQGHARGVRRYEGAGVQRADEDSGVAEGTGSGYEGRSEDDGVPGG